MSSKLATAHAVQGEAARTGASLQFDSDALDARLGEAGIDILIASSKHNIQYLLGGYRFFMFDDMDAIGLSRYLPVFVYPRGRPDKTFYVGNVNEKYGRRTRPLRVSTVLTRSRGTIDAMHTASIALREGISTRSDRRRNRIPAGRRLNLCHRVARRDRSRLP